MRTPILFTAVVLAVAWLLVGFGLPLLAGVALFFCLCGLVSWAFTTPAAALGGLLTLAVFSPPGVAFALGVTDGFFGDRAPGPTAAERVPGDALLEVPYTAGVDLFGGLDPVTPDVR